MNLASPITSVQVNEPSKTLLNMPYIDQASPLLDRMTHVHIDPIEDTWAVGLNQPPPYVKLSMKLDEEAYHTFRHTVPRPRNNYMYVPGEPVETYFYTYTNSSLDVITVDTANRLSILQSSLIQPSAAGLVLFEVSEMPLKGALLAEWGYIDPITQSATSTSSLVYIADCEDNHVSTSTMEALGVRKDNSLGTMLPLYLPMNN